MQALLRAGLCGICIAPAVKYSEGSSATGEYAWSAYGGCTQGKGEAVLNR
jgi:hypothetical protein